MSGRGVLVFLLVVGCRADAPVDDGGGAGGCAGVVAGDLVLSEIMADPGGGDAGKEWVEVYNAGPAERGLGGLMLAVARADGAGEKSVRIPETPVAAGGFAIVREDLPALPNG